jgi:2-keto-4-pentenoate hydratase/2-oxohepta-3-ene-1,7-dioic acid hydratase in catechol pathway
MRLVRFRFGDRIATGVLEDSAVRVLRGTFFEDPVPTGEEVPVDDVRLLAPVLPSKVVCVGRNYAEHAAELGGEVPAEPLLFLKPSTAVIGPGDPIPLLPISERVDHEAELAVVVGRLTRRGAGPDEVERSILGSMCGNDVTLRDLQGRDGQWTRAKGFDGSCPLGPWIETEPPADAEVLCRVNGEVRQRGRTSQLTFGPVALVAYITRFMSLLPGDVIMTGTPAGVGPLSAGDEVEVEVEGVGVLRNPVVEG